MMIRLLRCGIEKWAWDGLRRGRWGLVGKEWRGSLEYGGEGEEGDMDGGRWRGRYGRIGNVTISKEKVETRGIGWGLRREGVLRGREEWM
jgi:hypothetical protein